MALKNVCGEYANMLDSCNQNPRWGEFAEGLSGLGEDVLAGGMNAGEVSRTIAEMTAARRAADFLFKHGGSPS